jgi:hypothetical protein
MIVNNERERMWKQAIVAQFKILSRKLPGRTEDNYETLANRVDVLSNSNRKSPEYTSHALLPEPNCTVMILLQ